MKNLNLVVSLLFIMTVAITCNMSPTFKEYKSDSGGFTINAPGDMKEASQDVPSAVGNLKMTTYTADLGSSAYLVSSNEYPDVSAMPAQDLLKAVQKGAVDQVSGTIVSEKEIDLNGNPGREYVANIKPSGKEAFAKSHLFLVKNRLYQVLVIVPKSDSSSPDVDKFLDSFKLTGK